MGSKAEEYRRKAEDAEKTAAETSDVVAKRKWREIADPVANHGGNSGPPGTVRPRRLSLGADLLPAIDKSEGR
jgi:hypothetical protein